jgi:hypothetical protein
MHSCKPKNSPKIQQNFGNSSTLDATPHTPRILQLKISENLDATFYRRSTQSAKDS